MQQCCRVQVGWLCSSSHIAASTSECKNSPRTLGTAPVEPTGTWASRSSLIASSLRTRRSFWYAM